MNAIILPRAIALQCQLNDTLYDLQNVTNTPLNCASFYSTDPLKATASGHIIAVISKNVTASQAETILTMLTHNATGGRIGNNVTISTTALYLLHLPNDILSAIPTSVMNSGMGEGPNYYSLGSIISDIAGMAFDFLVWVATGGVLLLLAHLVKEGLKVISNLISTAISAVEAAVDRIVDAFCAMVEWVIGFIQGTIDSLMNGMIGGLQQLGNAFCGQAHISCNAAAIDYNTTGVVSQEQINKIAAALIGTFFHIPADDRICDNHGINHSERCDERFLIPHRIGREHPPHVHRSEIIHVNNLVPAGRRPIGQFNNVFILVHYKSRRGPRRPIFIRCSRRRDRRVRYHGRWST
jgi:hypothetical protein